MTSGAFGLEAIGCAIPRLQAVEEIVREAGLDDAFSQRLHLGGLHDVPVAAPGPLADLVIVAVNDVMAHVAPWRVGAFLFCHSVPIVAPMDVPFLNSILDAAGIERVPSVTVSGQPCAILHNAVRLAGAWSRTLSAGRAVLIVGADRAYTARQRLFFGSAMGDAAVACIVSADSPRHRVLASYQHTHIMAAQGELSHPDRIAAFRELNPAHIRSAIFACLAQARLSIPDVALFIPHTPYLSIWDTVAHLARIPRDRILTDYIRETGHLNSNDSFVHYERAVREGRLKSGDVALLVNPGFGGTRGCTLIRC